MNYETYLQEAKTAVDNQNDVDFGYTMKLDFGSDKIIYIDDTGDECIVSNENKDANITFVLSEITWEKMKTNQIGGAQAFAEGNMTVKGDFRMMIYAGNLFKKLTT